MKHGTGGCMGLAALFAAISSCSDSENAALQLSMDQSGEVVAAAVDQEIDVTLQAVGPALYGTPTISSSAVVFDEMTYIGPPVPAGPKQRFTFQARSVGEATIVIPHAMAGTDFSITVAVE